MNRRENLRSLLLGGISIPFIGSSCSSAQPENEIVAQVNGGAKNTKESPWYNMRDMDWAGPDYWGNRLQDWRVKDGKLECLFTGPNRTLHCLTHQLGRSRNRFSTTLHFSIPSDASAIKENRVGFLLGAKSNFRDYRAAAIRGKGLAVGVNTLGNLFIGDVEQKDSAITKDRLEQGIILEIQAEPLGMKYKLVLKAYDTDGSEIARYEKQNIEPDALEGNVAILSDWKRLPRGRGDNKTSCIVNKWVLEGDKLEFNADHNFGPISFVQYTKERDVLKLTAQMMPVELPGTAVLEIKDGDAWKKIAETKIEYPSYTAHFRMTDWNYNKAVPYRVVYNFSFKDDSTQRYYWEGTIAEEPVDKTNLKALVMSCNFDYGFPDQEVVDYGSMHEPDIIMFLGDQFYEPNGGFGIQRAPLEKAYLDYLRKWYQFGWSYRELFRHRPTINLPDDHDVFQGNLFGAGGRPFPKNAPNGFNRDHGGFMMPPEWVNMVMTTQTSHMPDAFDPEPAKQGIHVLYTDWKYAGVSFGIVEDRKFKSGPAAVLPKEAGVRDAFVTNENYDISKHTFPDADLLGERQLDFLKHWIEDWDQQTELKVLVSATSFQGLQTLPDGAASNGDQRKLYVPPLGEYVEGDVPVADTDSGGWPQNKRNKVLSVVRKAFAVHLTGDQHLPAVTQYGIDEWQDAGVTFAVPALANSWPRRWWPPVPENHKPIPGQPAYTGNYEDAFGNKMYVMAVANPHQTGLEPNYLYDRSAGYGVVTFNKENREVKMECWPRYVNPKAEPDKQFKGWPLTVKQQDNFNPPNAYLLPTIAVEGASKPVIRVISEENGELVHILRMQGNSYQPRVPNPGKYAVVVEDTLHKTSKRVAGLEALSSNDRVEKVVL